MRILAIGAHPDDLELGAAGTIAKNVKQNHDVLFLILTFGEQEVVAQRHAEKRLSKVQHCLESNMSYLQEYLIEMYLKE